MAGVERYISAFADWQVIIEPPDYLPNHKQGTLSWLQTQDLDGLLVRDATMTMSLLRIDKPKVIHDTQRELIPDTSTIMADSESIGQLAAEYFLELGFKNFAYSGFHGLAWSHKRFDSFEKTLKEHGAVNIFDYWSETHEMQSGTTLAWKLAEWLKTLPRPLCVFTCNDDSAIYLLQACRIAYIPVPEEVAVLGVDNDELICNLASPPLSSIELGFEQAGFLAARHLDELIRNEAQHQVILVRPIEIVNRRSTDILAIEDKHVVNALVFIRSHFQNPIQAEDVVKAARISRRELEKRFKKYLNKTIKNEIDRLRIEWVKKRLANSNEPIYHIAESVNFTDPEHFSRYFKKATGMTPTEFRKEC